MIKKELRKISLEYRTLSSQMLKIDSQEEIYCIRMFFDFITNTPVLHGYITSCHTKDYDFKDIFQKTGWNSTLILPSTQEEIIDYGYQLLQYILDGPKQLFSLGQGYTRSNKIRDAIEAFMRKSIEPFVIALRRLIELELIDSNDNLDDTQLKEKTIFLSYCQKDSDIADLIDRKLGALIEGRAKISRDIRDVEYHASFKRFMQSIEYHDYVITIISDSYFKSRNCMYEVMEVVKNPSFADKLIFIVLQNEDSRYYKLMPAENIGADVYSPNGITKYMMYWKQQAEDLKRQIDSFGNPAYAISQAKELKNMEKILLDLSEFIEYIRDSKAIPLSEHIENEFSDIRKFMSV